MCAGREVKNGNKESAVIIEWNFFPVFFPPVAGKTDLDFFGEKIHLFRLGVCIGCEFTNGISILEILTGQKRR